MYRYTCSEQSADAATVACGVEIVASLIRAGGTGEGDLPTVARALVARMAEKRRAMEGAADFIAAPSFRGHKEGFVFMTASEGLGYYRDVGSTIAAPKEASSEDLEACNAARERGNAFYKAKDHAGALEVRVICFVCVIFVIFRSFFVVIFPRFFGRCTTTGVRRGACRGAIEQRGVVKPIDAAPADRRRRRSAGGCDEVQSCGA